MFLYGHLRVSLHVYIEIAGLPPVISSSFKLVSPVWLLLESMTDNEVYSSAEYYRANTINFPTYTYPQHKALSSTTIQDFCIFSTSTIAFYGFEYLLGLFCK